MPRKILQENPRENPPKFIQQKSPTSEENKEHPKNATHPKTQNIGRSENLHFRVCCVFGCSLFPSKRAPKHNTPENATHPKSQILGTVDYLRFRVCCVFGCFLAPATFLLVLKGNWGPKKKPINRTHINIFLTALVGQSSQGRTPTRPRDKRDKMAIVLWN